jgi:hypothetical protein
VHSNNLESVVVNFYGKARPTYTSSKSNTSHTTKMTSLTAHGLKSTDIHEKIALLTHNLVNINDTTGEFLLKLDDGRVIDTKGWDGWEWTHGIGLYGK